MGGLGAQDRVEVGTPRGAGPPGGLEREHQVEARAGIAGVGLQMGQVLGGRLLVPAQALEREGDHGPGPGMPREQRREPPQEGEGLFRPAQPQELGAGLADQLGVPGGGLGRGPARGRAPLPLPAQEERLAPGAQDRGRRRARDQGLEQDAGRGMVALRERGLGSPEPVLAARRVEGQGGAEGLERTFRPSRQQQRAAQPMVRVVPAGIELDRPPAGLEALVEAPRAISVSPRLVWART